MRQWHRWFGTAIGLFVVAIAISGVGLQIQFLINNKASLYQPGGLFCSTLPSQSVRSVLPVALRTEDIQHLIATSIQAAQRVKSGAQITSIHLEIIGDEPQTKIAVKSVDSGQSEELTFYATTGEPVRFDPVAPRSTINADLPVCALGFDQRLHRWLLDFHTFHMFGDSGKWLSLFVGLGLIVLSVTGLTVYVGMLVRRIRQLGNRKFFWR